MPEKRILFLTLSKKPFEVMISGEKKEEFRTPSKWIKSRLMRKDGTPKHYDEVLFVNGYGKDKPCFRSKYKGFEVCDEYVIKSYSNGLTVPVTEGMYVIKLGENITKNPKREDV